MSMTLLLDFVFGLFSTPFVIVLFILLTNPISSNLLIRATHRIKVPLASKAIDAYEEDKEKGNEKEKINVFQN